MRTERSVFGWRKVWCRAMLCSLWLMNSLVQLNQGLCHSNNTARSNNSMHSPRSMSFRSRLEAGRPMVSLPEVLVASSRIIVGAYSSQLWD